MRNHLKAISAVVLISVVIVFTGLPAPLLSAPIENGKSCCNECSKENSKTYDHCSTPDCPMFLCLSVNVDPPFMPKETSEKILILPLVEQLNLKSPAKQIFHPPLIYNLN